MRALTLTQPWCGLVASGIKLVENRPRPMIKSEDFGKPFALHASREIDEDAYGRIFEIAPELRPEAERRWWYMLTRISSAVIAVAVIEREIHAAFDINKQIYAIEIPSRNPRRPPQQPGPIDLGDQLRWFFGRIGYVLRDVRALAEPVPCRGFQGFWTLTHDVQARVAGQLSRTA